MKSPADRCRTISCDSYGIDPIRCDWYTRPKTQDDYHSHLDFYELVVVLEGSARDEWEGKEQKLVPGIFFVYAPGSRHIYTHLWNPDFRISLIFTVSSKNIFPSCLMKCTIS